MRRSFKSWRPHRVAALTVGPAVGMSLGVVPARAVPGVPSAVFDPDNVRSVFLYDQTAQQFDPPVGSGSFDEYKAAGYMIVDLDIESNGTVYRVGSVWQENTDGRDWRLERDLDGTAFGLAWDDAVADGMRLVDQESYLVDGERRYAGVWVENIEGLDWASRRDMDEQTLDTFNTQQQSVSGQPRMPIDIDQYVTSAGVRWAAVWVENTENLD
ncbi:hypothetical protein [Thermomonospora umbrina]|uniref:Uncharacterized protein n=1 Tax=Thermomonospora umbrina TaxID=111806 RepID=A0A3D9SSR6_9ACTN|nr:hypothetical protein [Thermomonospora umbrina]REE94751.1 hypothetical protein DFJ69_0109 [Thermomonospora umbrina]